MQIIELADYRTYLENQVILDLIFLYRASKYKQTKEQGNKDCLWAHIFTILCDCCQLFFIFSVKMQRKQDETVL